MLQQQPPPVRPRVLMRVVRYPLNQAGELLAVYVDSRSKKYPTVVVYSATKEAWRVEVHKQLMWRTRRATPEETDRILAALELIGEKVRVLRAAPRAEPDEVPASVDT